MYTTIKTEFDPNSLPLWARKNTAVIALAEKNLAFRCDVFSAKDKATKKVLTKTAERIINK